MVTWSVPSVQQCQTPTEQEDIRCVAARQATYGRETPTPSPVNAITPKICTKRETPAPPAPQQHARTVIQQVDIFYSLTLKMQLVCSAQASQTR